MATYAGVYSEHLQDRYGNGYRNALVAVQTLAAAPVTLYADRVKTAYVPASGLAANEIKADTKGNLRFFADPGNYQIVVTPSGGSTLAAFPISVLPDPLEPDASEGALAAEQEAREDADTALDTAKAEKSALPLLADEFGLPTDGTTDSITELRAAVAGAVAANRQLLFRRRTYLITENLDLPSDLDVDFGGSTIKIADGVDKSITGIRVMGTHDISVRNLTLRCNRANRTPGTLPSSVSGEYISGNGITTRTTNDVNKTYAADLLFENVHVYDSPNHAWEIVGAERVRIISCSSKGYGDDGFSVGGKNAANDDLQPARMVSLVNCVARGGLAWDGSEGTPYSTNSNGFEVDDGANNVTITGCLSENNYAGGYQFHGHAGGTSPHDLTVTGNVARNNQLLGIRCDAETGALDQSYNVTISGNTIVGSGMSYGIRIRNSNNVIVANNALKGNLISLSETVTELSVTGNLCSQIVSTAGSGAAPGNWTIADNTVVGSAAEGVYIVANAGVTLVGLTVAGNVVRNAATYGIRATGFVSNIEIANNIVRGHTLIGIVVQPSAVTDVTIVGNSVTHTEGTGTANTECILVSSRAVVSGNHCTGGRDGVRLNAGASDSVVGNNVIKSPGSSGVNLVAVNSVVVSGNRIVTTGRGIDAATSGNDHVIVGNIISGMASNGIRQQAGCDHWLITGNNYRGITISLTGANNVLGTNKT